MKNFLFIILVLVFLVGCNSAKNTGERTDRIPTSEQDTVKIANDDLEYEIIIIEPGFNNWLQTIAKPEGYYSQEFLEGRNWQYVSEWNRRARLPSEYGNMYDMTIDYDQSINYGYEVNYKLYYYFIYFQLQFNQRLAGFVPRI
ncbi:hypothetical protein SAMN03097699_1085 [Flavobacteriaceae bacterium MAR_2010_188]|nr:hypothetical protein SAMN03097699_1085 [Flavobacteriaceae bacterium MAR_2010_188]